MTEEVINQDFEKEEPAPEIVPFKPSPGKQLMMLLTKHKLVFLLGFLVT